MNPNDKPPPRDYRAEVTADVIKMLEEGTAPWQKPWKSGEAGRIPWILRLASPIEEAMYWR